jgi:hypothetical protein
MRRKDLLKLVVALFVATSIPAWAGSWQTQTLVANGGIGPWIAIDGSGNLAVAWGYSAYPISENLARSGAIGQTWGATVNLTGAVTGALDLPQLHASASGNFTVVYNQGDPALSMFVDHVAGGGWSSPATIPGSSEAGQTLQNFPLFISNDHGDQAIVWGGGGPRGNANPIKVAVRPAGGVWQTPATIATGTFVTIDGGVTTPDGTTAVAWESYQATCGSRVCKTTNWTLHVSSLAPGSQTWVDSGALLVSASSQNHGLLAADSNHNIGLISISGGNVVSLVRHSNGVWTSPVTVASTSSLGLDLSHTPNEPADNRSFASDSAGHATVVGWGNVQNSNLVAVNGNLQTNTWGAIAVISGSDQNPGYFRLAVSSAGQAIVAYPLTLSSNITRAVVRPGPTSSWGAPATVGNANDSAALPLTVTINSAGQAAVAFSAYTSDFTSFINYVNTYQP